MRDESTAASGWYAASLGLWVRRLHGAPDAAVRLVRGGAYEMRLGGGPWLPAAATLLRATEHAGGHQSLPGLGAEAPCGECRRLQVQEGNRA